MPGATEGRPSFPPLFLRDCICARLTNNAVVYPTFYLLPYEESTYHHRRVLRPRQRAELAVVLHTPLQKRFPRLEKLSEGNK